jgi:hypothetical protein
MWASNTESSKTNNGRGPADSRQVGGSHYQDVEGEQHWTRIYRLFGPGYFIGCVTKYVERYQKKNGIEDLLKAQHYVDKLIELESANVKHYFADMGGTACGITTGKGVEDPREITCLKCKKLMESDVKKFWNKEESK